MPDEKRTEKFQLMMSPTEIEAIDDWSFRQRIRTRAEAIRRLCQIGLAASETAGDIYESGKSALTAATALVEARSKLGPITKDEGRNIQFMLDSTLRIMAQAVLAEAIRKGASRSDVDVDRIIERIPGFKDAHQKILSVIEEASPSASKRG